MSVSESQPKESWSFLGRCGISRPVPIRVSLCGYATTGEVTRLQQNSLVGGRCLSHRVRGQAPLPEASWAEDSDAGVGNQVPSEMGAKHEGEEGPVGTLRNHACDFRDVAEHRAR